MSGSPDDRVKDEEALRQLGYNVGRVLGRGTYAKVLLAELRGEVGVAAKRPSASGGGVRKFHSPVCTTASSLPHQQLACKVIDTRRAPKDFVRNFLPREIDILSTVRHPHIVHIHSIWQWHAKYYIFMRFAERGDLLDFVLKNGAVSEDQARIWLRQMALAVQYLHEMGIAHRDLKCENVLISSKYNVKLGDFGFARRVLDKSGNLQLSSTYCGSLAYAPPEIIEGKPYNPKAADIWSLGVVLYIMLNKSLPFDTSCPKKQYAQQVSRDWKFRSKVIPFLSENVQQLTEDMLEPIPTARMSIEEVLLSPYIAMEPRLAALSPSERQALLEARASLGQDKGASGSTTAARPSSEPSVETSVGSSRSNRGSSELRPIQGPSRPGSSGHSSLNPGSFENNETE